MIEFNKKGMYCPQGDFYIDPWRPVERALITHAHGDHARYGHKYYLSHHDSIPIMKVRLGFNIYDGVAYGEQRIINGVKVSFHPAGHIIGSSQIRLEYKGEVWVASGDYKTEFDGISPAFEPVKCDTFITESTFGLPVYHWSPQNLIFDEINAWWNYNRERGITSVMMAYSLGKAQRLLHNIDRSIGPIYLQGAVYNMHKAMRDYGMHIPYSPKLDADLKKDQLSQAFILTPPNAANEQWYQKFNQYAVGESSGWMAAKGTRHGKAQNKGFTLSDHADWPGLNEAIKATGAERIIVTHGYTETFAKWLREQGYDARTVETQFKGEEAEIINEAEADPEIVDTETKEGLV